MSGHPETDQELTFLEHLVELRGRLLKACLSIVVVLVCLLPFSRQLYQRLADPWIHSPGFGVRLVFRVGADHQRQLELLVGQPVAGTGGRRFRQNLWNRKSNVGGIRSGVCQCHQAQRSTGLVSPAGFRCAGSHAMVSER